MGDGQDATEVTVEHIGLQDLITADATTGNEMKPHPEVQAVPTSSTGFAKASKTFKSIACSCMKK
jgi:phosphoglycolate phosphatase-like HAD superfamily hydrolase